MKAIAPSVLLVLLALASLLDGFPSALAQHPPPPRTCDEVAAATTRGGATLSSESRVRRTGCTATPARRGELVRVERVVDGDTVVIAGGERVRYIGVDAPELRPQPEPFASEAAAANRRMVEGRYVLLISGATDRDRFGRLLRYVMVDGILVEADLVREGLARTREYQPGQPYATCIAALEAEARSEGRGLWGGA